MSKLRAFMRDHKSEIKTYLDVVMLAEIFILGRVLLGGRDEKIVEWMQIVYIENIELFEQFNWGSECFNELLKSLRGVADSVDKNDDQNVHTKKKNLSSSLESHVENGKRGSSSKNVERSFIAQSKRSSRSDKGGNDSIVGGYTSICTGTYDAGEGGQEANLEDFQKISTVQVTTIVNLDDDSVVSTRQVNEHTNVSSHHQVGNIISYKRKKKFHTASPPHSEVQTQNEQGSSPKTFGESGVGNAVIEDVYPLDTEYGVFAVGDRTRENVEPLLTDPLQTHTLPSQQGESLVGEERMEAHDSVSLDPIKAATRKTLGTEQLSVQVQSSVGDERIEEGYSDALQSTGVPPDAKIEPE
ncbi:hypothetical protein RND71_034614 [Anisodus tanguticus]|uniref:DUF1985 domain-containing protein n=1 Tax=Anisodus tanguticus TaxID=243964 RepID=A0AAE1RA02_9SOLA|nr:hypothetical protein RND71_034614 [Anisodus tanguticus]